MAIAGVVVVATNRYVEKSLRKRLESLKGVEIKGIGKEAIAVVLEAADGEGLKCLSEKIDSWREVRDFQLVYFNWEKI